MCACGCTWLTLCVFDCARADPVQWREIAFCLSQLQMSERSVRGLVDNMRLYKHTLADATVASTFAQLAAKVCV